MQAESVSWVNMNSAAANMDVQEPLWDDSLGFRVLGVSTQEYYSWVL